MIYKKIGASDLRVSELGLGCMSLGRAYDKAAQLLHKAVDLGVNFFDTADIYDQGENEITLGKAFKGMRSEVLLASKVGNKPRLNDTGWDWNPRKAYIHEAVRHSLKRLQTDYIDLYQLHGGTIDDPIDETIEAFEELQTQGLIRYYGISSIRPNVIREYVERAHIVSVQMQYSLLDRRPEEEIFPLLQSKGISVLVRGALAQGILAGKPPKQYIDHNEDRVGNMVREVMDFAGKHYSLTQIALKFALQHPVVGSVLGGASKIPQLEENVLASIASDIEEPILERLYEIFTPLTYSLHK